MKRAVVLITMIPIFIFLMLQMRTIKDMPAITNATIAMNFITDTSWMALTITIFILPYAHRRVITPKVMMAAKYRIIVVMTKHPPQALMKIKSRSDRINVIKIIDNDIGHVAFKSAIDSS